jgi:hypothetical protein
MIKISPIFASMMLIMMACNSSDTTIKEANAYEQTILEWRKARVDNLTSGNSWLSLAGLYRLKEGENTFGSGTNNQLKFPKKAATNMGAIHVEGDSVYMLVEEEVAITKEGIPVKQADMQADSSGSTPIFHYESLNWNVIKRGEQYLVRLRDTLNEAIAQFTHIDYFDIDEAWKLEARFETFDSAKTTVYQNVLGMALELDIEGQLVFEKDGKEYTLDALDGGPDEFFVIFEDETTGDSTYGGGRYIYVARPDDSNTTYIDFNKAYNPPCAFTPFATCLLPTEENKLALSIPAGEKNFGDH